MIRLAVQASRLNNLAEILSLLLILAFVLVLTYFVTRWVAVYQKGQMRGHNLQVIETLRVTNNKFIQIVRAGDEYLVVAIGKDEMHLLTRLTKEQLEKLPADDSDGGFPVGNFKDVLEKMKEHLPKK
ncbi:MAG: flagellar biosynthetic protein FliO [Roseburia sp.]|nr:flagellar biosynthetic protein FliO [Roseburia sp.]